MKNLRVHPSLKRHIKQQFSPAFANENFVTFDKHAAAPVCASKVLSWPAPPPEFLSFHAESLMQHLWSRLTQLIESPVEILQITAGWRALQITGCAIFVQAPDSQIQIMLWQRDGRKDHHLLQVQARVVMLTETPYRMLWLNRLEDLAVARICEFHAQQGLGLTLETAEKYAHWMFEIFARMLHKRTDLRLMRQRCAQALELKIDLVQAAHQLSLFSPENGKAKMSDYNFAVQHAPAIAQLQKDCPAMLRLFATSCAQPGFPSQGEPLARIRQYLRVLHLSDYVWHLALNKGARLLLPMREFYSDSAAESLSDFLLILMTLKVQPRDTPTALRLLFSEFGHENARRAAYWPLLEPHQAAFSHLLRVVREWQAGHPPTEVHIALVVRWIVSNDIKGWDRAQRQRGWLWLLTSAQAWQSLALARQKATPIQWPVPFDTLIWASLAFTTLRKTADLILEGQKMRNCAATYTAACQSGSQLMVAVALSNGRRVATASYQSRAGVWQLVSAKAPANRALKPGIHRLVEQFSKHIPCTDGSTPEVLSVNHEAANNAYGEIADCNTAVSANPVASSAAHAELRNK